MAKALRRIDKVGLGVLAGGAAASLLSQVAGGLFAPGAACTASPCPEDALAMLAVAGLLATLVGAILACRLLVVSILMLIHAFLPLVVGVWLLGWAAIEAASGAAGRYRTKEAAAIGGFLLALGLALAIPAVWALLQRRKEGPVAALALHAGPPAPRDARAVRNRVPPLGPSVKR